MFRLPPRTQVYASSIVPFVVLTCVVCCDSCACTLCVCVSIGSVGLVKECVRSLKEQNITVTVFDDVSPDPTEASVLQARDAAAELGVDGVVGFGGGSSMDVAKVVAYLAHEHNANTHIGDVYGVGNCRCPCVW